MPKVLMVASEASPFAKTGGLADVVGALPRCMHQITADDVIRAIELYFEGGAIAPLTRDEFEAVKLSERVGA